MTSPYKDRKKLACALKASMPGLSEREKGPSSAGRVLQHEQSSEFNPQHQINQAWQYIPVIPAHGVEAAGSEVRGQLSYIDSSKPVEIGDPFQ